jgi:hypothetical protein
LAIDWNFISQQEGGQKLKGYVPSGNKKSGVTIATGFDIGQRSRADIGRMPIAQGLKTKLTQYAALTRQSAVAALGQAPLSITKSEADSIDRSVKSSVLSQLRRNYNVSTGSGVTSFDQLPSEAQTVIASLAFQYGDLRRETPIIWNLVTQQNWFAAIQELNNFGDLYPSRRRREAAYLGRIASTSPVAL